MNKIKIDFLGNDLIQAKHLGFISCHRFNKGQNNVDLRTEKVSHFEKLEGK
jgi:hypothetical protein